MSRKKKPSRQEQLEERHSAGQPVTYREWKDAIAADIRAMKLDATGLVTCRDKVLTRIETLNADLACFVTQTGRTINEDYRNAQRHLMLQLEVLNELIGDV